jgi:phage recombination protein Bet
MAREPAQAMTIAPRYLKPANFAGTPTAWRALCEVYPSAETAEVIMAVVEYCAVRHLDPYKRPVHVVPMYNSRLRRKVQVVMQGINEIEITASRTGKWAGMDEAKWGPTIERTFRGTFDREDGRTDTTEVTLTFPEWCSVTVYRLVGDQPRAFTETLWWEESYGRAGFRSEVPNARWQQARRQMLHKCTKAAVLRTAFPEEGLDYAAEEMDGHETDGGLIIDGVAEAGAAGPGAAAGAGQSGVGLSSPPPRNGELKPSVEAAREKQSAVYANPPGPDPLARLTQATTGREWLLAFEAAAKDAANTEELAAIATHRTVRDALANYPTLIQAQIRETLRLAHERLAPTDEQPDPPDPLADLLAEVAAMDLTTIAGLPDNAAWRTRMADLFPTDADRIDEAVADRKAALTQPGETRTRDDNSATETNPGP